VEARVARVFGRRRVPLDEHPPPFGLGQQRQLPQRPVGIGDDPLQQGPELPSIRSIVSASNRSVLYSSAAIRPPSASAVVIVRSNWAVCISRASDSRGSPASSIRGPASCKANGDKALAVEPLGLLEGEHHLEQGRAAGVAGRLEAVDHQAEGEILMLQAVAHGAPDPPQEVSERGIPREVGPHRQRVDEVADDLGHPGPGPARHGGADDEIVLAGEAPEEGLERGQERDVRARPVGAAQVHEPPRQGPRPGRASGSPRDPVWTPGRGRSVGRSSVGSPPPSCSRQ
jgi:hypothetical protein